MNIKKQVKPYLKPQPKAPQIPSAWSLLPGPFATLHVGLKKRRGVTGRASGPPRFSEVNPSARSAKRFGGRMRNPKHVVFLLHPEDPQKRPAGSPCSSERLAEEKRACNSFKVSMQSSSLGLMDKPGKPNFCEVILRHLTRNKMRDHLLILTSS